MAGSPVDRARAGGLQLTGEGGVIQQLTKRLLEAALDDEITDHLGYGKHDPAGRDGGNSRNGSRAKTVLTDVGPGADQGSAGPRSQLRAQDCSQAAEAPGRGRRLSHARSCHEIPFILTRPVHVQEARAVRVG